MMAEATKIQWSDATFNPWRSCSKLSEGCANCYAERSSHRNERVLGEWGPNGTRPVAAEAQWREVFAWNERAAAEGVRRRVFCASIADVFEGPETMPGTAVSAINLTRARLFDTIARTPWLDWLLLTKRTDGIKARISEVTDYEHYRLGAAMARRWLDGDFPPNVWLGASVENQRRRYRILELCAVPARVRFLSVEPILEAIDLELDRFCGMVDWVIVGGESGAAAKVRTFDLAWAEQVIAECRAARVPVFVKQFGSRTEAEGIALKLIDRKGGDWEEWPLNLRVRQMPGHYLKP
jgi:protein gp37